MKKQILLITLLIASVFSLFAGINSDEGDLLISAFKETPPADANTTIKITGYNGDTTYKINKSFDINDKVKNDAVSIDKAFTITITTNQADDISISLNFSHFVNQVDTTKTIPATYTFSHENYEEVTTSKKDNYYYKYTPVIAIDDQDITNGDSKSITTGKTVSFVQKINQQRKSSSSGTYSNYTNTKTGTLIAISNKTVTSTSYFKLDLTAANYNAMVANQEYVSTVKLTITKA